MSKSRFTAQPDYGDFEAERGRIQSPGSVPRAWCEQRSDRQVAIQVRWNGRLADQAAQRA